MKLEQKKDGSIKIHFTWKDVFSILKNKNTLSFDTKLTKAAITVAMNFFVNLHAKLPENIKSKVSDQNDIDKLTK
jgi:hypothetical protein|tara:strand:- start:8047 stop:8271 length:225 start_codon:yes stop_codon:yes gene_type:complete